MKLKGLLKGFFILGLTLLPISFSSAVDYYSPFTMTSRCLYEVDYNITNNGNFSSYFDGIEKNNLLYFKGSTRTNCSKSQYLVFGWKNGKLYGFTRNEDGGVNQGYFNYYCYGAEPCGTMNVSIDTFKNILDNQGVKGFYFNQANSILGDFSFSDWLNICLITNSNNVPYACFYSGYPGNYIFSESLDYNVSDWDNLSSWDGFFDKSPLAWSPSSNNTISSPKDSIQNQYDSYRKLGYTDNLCYGGYSLDNLFGTGNSNFYDISVGSGATIFDLHSAYSGGQDIISWYDQRDYNYWYFEQFRDSYEYNKYIGMSKGMFGLFMVKDLYYKKDAWLTASLIDFCRLVINNSSSIDKTKTPIDVINDSVNENALNQLIGDIGILIHGSGSALDVVVGSLSGYSDFSTAWGSGFDMFTSIKSVSDRVGILPAYICIGLLLFVLLYLFRK